MRSAGTLLVYGWIVVIGLTYSRGGVLVAVIVVGLAASAHQGWSANLYSAISDVMPKTVVSTIVGLGAAAAGLATMGAAQAVGLVLDRTHSFAVLFCIASTPYLISLGVLHYLVPRFGAQPPAQALSAPA